MQVSRRPQQLMAKGCTEQLELPAGAYTISVVVSGAKIFQSRAALGPAQVLTLGVSGPPTAQSETLPPLSSAPKLAATASVPATALPSEPVPSGSRSSTDHCWNRENRLHCRHGFGPDRRLGGGCQGNYQGRVRSGPHDSLRRQGQLSGEGPPPGSMR